MPPFFRLVLATAVLILSAACQRAPDTDGTDAPASGDGAGASAAASAASNRPAAATPPGEAPSRGAPPSAYVCADGTRLEAGFARDGATLQWPGGRRLSLPRAESASRGGGDVYVGETVSVQRDGASLQLHDGDRAPTRCDPAAAGGAARYACDAGTVLTRNDDGSYRAEIPGNPAVRLARIAGSEPPVYTGASLYLRIGDGGSDAMLSQGDRATELRCTAD